ncbi:hypothetical protein Pint_34565 [Pistacia integerrima]|uniref:Uncharacterized protein n=1 Tax=Pistacia integerrima TaxID=434235 RepID=A0ACC0X3N4_9ROSI|nr:hypothetical protein Pint_34565 [Pistacia integerrima]
MKIPERKRNGFIYIKCSYCLRPIHAGREISYHQEEESFQHSIWPQIKYCKIHVGQIPKCCICEKYQPKDEKYIKLVDERMLCNDCRWTAIMDVDKLQSLKNYLLHFFKVNHVSFKKDIPIYLVDINDIKRLSNRGAVLSDTTIISCTLEEENMMEIVPNRLQELQLKPPWILIAYGLPWLIAGELLAQEMMHVWLQLKKDYKTFNWPLKEGICRAMAYNCLGYITDPAGSEREKRIKFFQEMRAFRKTRIQNERPQVFGLGYMGATNAIKRYGLISTLDRIFAKTNGGTTQAAMNRDEDFEYTPDYVRSLSRKISS